ncbi:indole-3-pyruvate monooxygenase YUCCA1-like [Nymphaea colorata]|nr:indole-3-pyruvate monooxygenase YUCCA1-like [Nymphaea colorata]
MENCSENDHPSEHIQQNPQTFSKLYPTYHNLHHRLLRRRLRVYVKGPIIVGAGPAGLATAACLRHRGLPSLLLEKEDSIASLWRHHTYDRLKLHLPKRFCHLPFMPFPSDFPTYPSRDQFLCYLDAYARRFSLRPRFRQRVESAFFDVAAGLWRVAVMGGQLEYLCRWLVVATGENAEPAVPDLAGLEAYGGRVVHSSCYRNGGGLQQKNVLVVGCGNSGMEVCLDLCEHGAKPYMVVRSGVHVLPRDMFGISTFGVATGLLRWLPLRVVDLILVFLAERLVGDTQKFGLRRPHMGPMELKNKTGKTPVLDAGAISMIKNGKIKVVPEIDSLTCDGAKFVDGKEVEFHSIILATGYKTNFSSWLKDPGSLSENGKFKSPFPHSWKGADGLYFVGFAGKGLVGAATDAERTAADIKRQWGNSEREQPFLAVQ